MAVNLAQTSASPQLLKQVFQTIDAESCPWSFNFHMHTVYSDGKLQPEALIEQAVTIGLKGLAITDHHTVSGYLLAQRWLENWKLSNPDSENSAPHLWSGVEINANLLGIEVHILGYAFDSAHPCLAPYLQRQAAIGDNYQADSVIAAIHKAGGLAVLAHPARYKRSHLELVPAAAQLGIDGIETYYSYNNPNPWQPSSTQTRQKQELAATYSILNTCGTDTHGLNLLQRH